MKNDTKFLIVAGVVSALIIALCTNFNWKDVDVQMHDTYFIIDPIRAWIYLTVVLWMIRNLYVLVDMMTERYKVFALLVAIINPVIAVLMILFFYLNVKMLMEFKPVGLDNNTMAHILPIGVLVLLIAVQTGVEVRMLRKLRGFIK